MGGKKGTDCLSFTEISCTRPAKVSLALISSRRGVIILEQGICCYREVYPLGLSSSVLTDFLLWLSLRLVDSSKNVNVVKAFIHAFEKGYNLGNIFLLGVTDEMQKYVKVVYPWR